ncbi:MAG: AIPR family protein [Neomegalonema sp.]|nr:AIPR family protein [Neomegalonema sp.]
MDQRLLDALRKFARNEIELFATPIVNAQADPFVGRAGEQGRLSPGALNPADPETFKRLSVYLALHRLDVPTVSYDDAFMDDAEGYLAIDGAALSVGDEPIYDVDTAHAAASEISAQSQAESDSANARGARPRILLVQATPFESVTREQLETFGQDVQRLFTRDPDAIGAASIELGRVARLIGALRKALVSGGPDCQPQVDIVLTFMGSWQPNERAAGVLQMIRDDLQASVPGAQFRFHVWGAGELVAAFERVALAAVGVLKSAHLLSLPQFKRGPEGGQQAAAGWIGYAPARSVVSLIEGADKQPDPRLFFDNVRHYLGDDPETNPGAAGLTGTLKQGDAAQLVLRHNGITIVARSAEIDSHSGDVMLRDFQVVNGAQTAFTLFANRAMLEESGPAHVPVKIVVTEDEAIKDGVVLGANTQSAVDRYDMLARRPELRALQLAFEADAHWSPQKLWLQRRRAEPFKTRVAAERVISPRQLLEAYAAVILGLPHRVHDNPAQFLDDVPDRIFAPGHEPNLYMALGWMIVAGRHWAARNHQRWVDRWEGGTARSDGYAARHHFLFALFRLVDPNPDALDLERSPAAAARFGKLVSLFAERDAAALTDLAGVIVREAIGGKLITADSARRLTTTEAIRVKTDAARQRLYGPISA